MEQLEKLRSDPKLESSLGYDITDNLLMQLLDTKKIIEKRQEE
jgi:hypothetical protein